MNDQELDKLLNQWETPETPPWLKTKVMQAVREESKSEQNVFARWLDKLSLPQVGLITALAILIVLVAVKVTPQSAEPAFDVVALEESLDSFAAFSNEETAWAEDPFL